MHTFTLESADFAPLPGGSVNEPAMPERLFLARVGAAVRVLRLVQRQTQARLARSAGISPATLAHMERGETAGTIITITAVERALGVKPGWLVRLAS